MGKKGTWFSVIKRVFSPNSKDKLADEFEKKNPKEKKKRGLGKLKHADSFIPLFREPSSIEKILGEAEQENHVIDFRPLGTFERPRTPSFVPSRAATPLQDATTSWTPTPSIVASPPRASSSQRVDSPPRVLTLRASSPTKGSTSQRVASSPKSVTLERTISPPTSAAPRELVSSSQASTSFKAARPATPPTVVSPPASAAPREVVSSSQAATPSKAPRPATPPTVVSPPTSAAPREVVSSSQAATSSKAPRPVTPPTVVSPPTIASPREVVSSSQAATSSKSARPATPPKSNSPKFVHHPRPEPTLRYQHACAIRIQAAYRGYKARKSYKGLRGLVRLQTVVKGQSAKRQTVNAMKSMQLMVRVQTQIQSRRIQMLENRALQLKALESQNANQVSENGNPDGWDDSRLTKDEVDARTQRKTEALIKRERAMAYAYSHQVTSKTPQAAVMDIRSSGGLPWWWSWLDRQANPSTMPMKPSGSPAIKGLHSTLPRATTASPLMPDSRSLRCDSSATGTPRSTKSAAVPSRMRLSMTPPSRILSNKFMRSRPAGSNSSPFKDDDSLMSCPPFSGPRFMEPTASTLAKTKGTFGASPDVQSKRRVSFPLAQGIGSFKWNRRGSLSSANTTPAREGGPGKPLERKPSMQSLGNMSVDSTVSMPAALGRKPFNRFV